ncbi:MAG TPA: hypothetical protein VKV17_05420 [Bryobacteraceae bacterium]|nr:hypothetical protein [Bryobacteraceae bacterium]
MIVVIIIELRSFMPLQGRRYAIEMRVDEPGVIVIRSGAVSGVDVLERREKESRQQPNTGR